MNRVPVVIGPLLWCISLLAACAPVAPAPLPETTTAPVPFAANGTPTSAAVARVESPTPSGINGTVLPVTPTIRSTLPITPCVPPPDWQLYLVKYGDTVYSLAKQTGVTEEEILRANCLSSPNLSLDQKLYLPVKVCIPTQPSGWGVYVVRLGDTLFSLAATRDTTVAEVKQANCLVSDSLQPGDRLYLPPLPYVPPQSRPAAPPAVSSSTQSTSVFARRDRSMPDLALGTGVPNLQFIPCTEGEQEPWISVFTTTIELGERAYFYACGFDDLETLAATLSDPRGTVPLPVMLVTDLPDPDQRAAALQGNPQRVIIWGAVCDAPTPGPYTVLLRNRQGQRATKEFTLKPPRFQQIMTVPYFGPPGTRFSVYYCGYTSEATREVQIDLYGLTAASATTITYTQLTDWNVPINTDGWACAELASQPDDAPGGYRLLDREGRLKGSDKFWLTQQPMIVIDPPPMCGRSATP
jgi:LysM repeat protein